MIFGIGTDITEVGRFKRWVADARMIRRFFNPEEFFSGSGEAAACQHYAARFAAKEAFSKALGTGLAGFELSDVYIRHDKAGCPELVLENRAAALLASRCGEARLFVSLSHEKAYAVATVVIEKVE